MCPIGSSAQQSSTIIVGTSASTAYQPKAVTEESLTGNCPWAGNTKRDSQRDSTDKHHHGRPAHHGQHHRGIHGRTLTENASHPRGHVCPGIENAQHPRGHVRPDTGSAPYPQVSTQQHKKKRGLESKSRKVDSAATGKPHYHITGGNVLSVMTSVSTLMDPWNASHCG